MAESSTTIESDVATSVNDQAGSQHRSDSGSPLQGKWPHHPPNKTSKVIGLYGLPGSGKSTLLREVKKQALDTVFKFFEGAEEVAKAADGMESFQSMSGEDKESCRRRAIQGIKADCDHIDQMVGVVTGHFKLWSEQQQALIPVWTEQDTQTYTHILYLNTDPEVILKRCKEDDRERYLPALEALVKWQNEEKTELRTKCRQNGILFSIVSSDGSINQSATKVLQYIDDFRRHTEDYNNVQIGLELNKILQQRSQSKTMLVLDADKTMAPQDTGKIFWKKVASICPSEYGDNTLKTLFESDLKYSYSAFRNATMLYESAANLLSFDTVCQEIAREVVMHPDIISLLQLVAEHDHIGAMVVTSGIRRVWELVLDREGLSKSVDIIGGGRIKDKVVVTPEVKGFVISRLKEQHKKYVYAFGDSPLDLEMLKKANEAIVIVGQGKSRSSNVNGALRAAIESEGLKARQALLPSYASPRLDTAILPIADLTSQDFVHSILCRFVDHLQLPIIHATDRNPTKLLAAPTRDPSLPGGMLREAHRRIGVYLATHYLSDIIGMESFTSIHVTGSPTDNYRLLHESKTTIVALMRAGEPLALGISDTFPRAMFVHAKDPHDLKPHHVKGQINIILADFVLNTGKTVIEFLHYVRNIHASVRIIIVAGVVQDQLVSDNVLARALSMHGNVHVVALRLSKTKYTGTRANDTGNRLFNTTHLE